MHQEGDEDLSLDWSLGLGASSLPAPPRRTLQALGLPEPIRQHFQSLDLEALRQMAPDNERYHEIPPRFHSASLLDSSSAHRSTGGSFGYPSSVYKVIDHADSHMYTLRRIDSIRSVQQSVIKNALTRWSGVRHPSVVTLHLVTQEKGALFFVHAYHPGAVTLKQRFVDSPLAASASSPLTGVSEGMLWRILVQLAGGLRVVHGRGLAIRHIHPSHVLLTSGTVARFASVGVTDVLEFESRKSLAETQADDLVKLGWLLLSLASRMVVGVKTAESAMTTLQRQYSSEVVNVVSALISGRRTIAQISALMVDRIQDELDLSLTAGDALHSHLRGEYENGRVLRLLIKLGFINERPEFARSTEVSKRFR